MLRAKWLFVAAILPLIGANAASAENDHGNNWDERNQSYKYRQYDDGQYDNGQLTSPERGITCDQSRGVCFDERGFDKGKTERYFGKQAAKDAEQRYGNSSFNGNSNWNDGYFGGGNSPRKGVTCYQQAKICTNKSGIDVGWTGEVFGNRAKSNAREWQNRRTFSPMRNVVCDNSQKVCFDRKRPSVELTKIYFGRKAAKDISWY